MNAAGASRDPLQVCLRCGFTLDEFRARGLLGCPDCYDQLGAALYAELLHRHPGLHRVPAPADAIPLSSDVPGADEVAGLRERLGDALRGERYEEAAALRREIARRTVP